jgi:hypothetical protein
MATNVEELKALDLENQGGEQEQEALKRAAQTDKVVRGVNGGVVPRARKLRPLAGIIVIAIVVLAALYMRHGMANRNKKTTKQTEIAKVGVGPATNVEKGLLSDQARNGLDTGQMHVPDSLTPRSSIVNTDGGNRPGDPVPGSANGTRASSVPPIEYRQGPVSTAANGSLSFAEQMRLDEYKREREAMEAATSVKGNLPSSETERSAQPLNDPLQAIQTALINARTAQSAGGGVQPASLQAGGLGSQEQRTEYERQNDQEQKGDFGLQHKKQESEYLGRESDAARGRYEVKAGWLPCPLADPCPHSHPAVCCLRKSETTAPPTLLATPFTVA